MSDALADAARLLLAEASPTTVRAVLRMLVDDVLPAAARPPLAVARPAVPRARQAPRACPRGVNPSPRPKPASQTPDAEWEALRSQVRDAMREQGIDFPTLGTALGVAPSSARVAIYRKQAPSRPLAAKLQAWLAANSAAPESLPRGVNPSPRGVNPSPRGVNPSPPAKAGVAPPNATFRGRVTERRGNGSAPAAVATVPASAAA
jgi:hypothetical protein